MAFEVGEMLAGGLSALLTKGHEPKPEPKKPEPKKPEPKTEEELRKDIRAHKNQIKDDKDELRRKKHHRGSKRDLESINILPIGESVDDELVGDELVGDEWVEDELDIEEPVQATENIQARDLTRVVKPNRFNRVLEQLSEIPTTEELEEFFAIPEGNPLTPTLESLTGLNGSRILSPRGVDMPAAQASDGTPIVTPSVSSSDASRGHQCNEFGTTIAICVLIVALLTVSGAMMAWVAKLYKDLGIARKQGLPVYVKDPQNGSGRNGVEKDDADSIYITRTLP
ncbi:hypothetical protein GMORB2_2387 [Geosmithia morbida]|uniref:Uncharacterized protein n=1 Tax=Geosmithia morbida TaxID=1094350 RepID=A0A9P5D1W9_9HYPO|nr:uncharacterized protein GMORB2_2387 [Geosmithia morbida]KAF4120901.1 hypothetical protein GMORB2_2387 [Geosmithia morbida]